MFTRPDLFGSRLRILNASTKITGYCILNISEKYFYNEIEYVLILNTLVSIKIVLRIILN